MTSPASAIAINLTTTRNEDRLIRPHSKQEEFQAHRHGGAEAHDHQLEGL